MSSSPPRVLLVGAGRFGRHHLEEWRRLERDGEAILAGVVVRTEASRDAIRERYGLPAYAGLGPERLAGIDAVDIVTPAASHASLVSACLEHADVLVEKPLAVTAESARELRALALRLGRVLMAGHIYRFNPVVVRLKEITSALDVRPRSITGEMINPQVDDVGRADPNLEFLHLFDIVDHLLGAEPVVCRGVHQRGLNQISLRYPGDVNVVLRLGWAGSARRRNLRLAYGDRVVDCDLLDNTIIVTRGANHVSKEFFPHQPEALRGELEAFLAAIAGQESPVSDAGVGARIVAVAERGQPVPATRRPRVAIVGGGVFGATIGIELGPHCDVTVYERHGELMSEASYLNQWRHHSGFHYPRSYDQIQEIRGARESFESEYEDAVNRSYPSYFCTSASGVEIPAERYLAACSSNYLSFTIEDPPPDVLDRSKVSICLRSDEAVYDYDRLKSIVRGRLDASPTIEVRLGAEVVDATIEPDGTKRLTVRERGADTSADFDYVVNATYANRNLFARWFGFSIEPVRFDVYELLVLRLPVPQICVTIMDGPFTSIVGMGHDNLFMLSHISDSVLSSRVTADGLPPDLPEPASNRANMLRHSSVYLPILARAEVVESRFALRTVGAFAKDFDARPTVVRDHGFGCWSVLGGKILTCVANAREIRDAILSERGTSASKPA